MSETKKSAHHLLIVCTANICRSPMAHWLAENYARTRQWNVEVRSGGTMGLEGVPAAPHAVKVMNEINLDMSSHKCRGITQDDIDWADYVLVMTLEHASDIRKKFENADGKLLQLASFGGFAEIKDPYRKWKWRFRQCRKQLEACVVNFMDQLPPRPL
jgi:protein-tyrosine phosphatase